MQKIMNKIKKFSTVILFGRCFAILAMGYLSFENFYFRSNIGMGIMWIYVGFMWIWIYSYQDREIKHWKEMTEVYIRYREMVEQALSMQKENEDKK